MRSQTVTGKQRCLQITIELALRISFVLSTSSWISCKSSGPFDFGTYFQTFCSLSWFRYEDKRWVPKDGNPKSPPRGREEKPSVMWQMPSDRNAHGYSGHSRNVSDERKNFQAASGQETVATGRTSIPAPPRGQEPVCWAFFALLIFCLCVCIPSSFLFLPFCNISCGG